MTSPLLTHEGSLVKARRTPSKKMEPSNDSPLRPLSNAENAWQAHGRAPSPVQPQVCYGHRGPLLLAEVTPFASY